MFSKKKTNKENHSVSIKTENLISESLSKPKTDDFKTDSNCKQMPLNSSTQRELKLLKKVYKHRKNVIKPKNKVINAHEKHFTTQMTRVSNSISLEQKESSFISENIIQKIPINAILYKDKKIITLNEDSDWDPEKHKCSTKKKDGKVTKQKNIKNIIEKLDIVQKNIKHIIEKQDIVQKNIKHIKNIIEKQDIVQKNIKHIKNII